MPPHVHLLATGGTIASAPAEGGATPDLSAEDLLAVAPGLDDHADLTAEEVARVPGFDVDPGIMTAVARRAREALRDGADGVVVSHGTDTLAETAYLLDLVLDEPRPVVVTGAQRRPDEPGSDAPANLLAAVRAASHDRLRRPPGEGPAGVFVAFDDDLHAARDVQKAHTAKLSAFRSPNRGPVAALARDGMAFHREPRSESGRVPLLDAGEEPTAGLSVPIVTSAAGVGAGPLDRAVDAGVDGVVVAGTGLGNVTAALGVAVGEAVAAGVPVVVASRCRAGRTGAVYGTPGGGVTLRERGAVHAGDLPAWKARVELLCRLAVADDPMAAARAVGEE